MAEEQAATLAWVLRVEEAVAHLTSERVLHSAHALW
jgi:hypothetical protein